MDGFVGEQKDGWIDGQRDRRIDGWIDDTWVDRQVEGGWLEGRVFECMSKLFQIYFDINIPVCLL